MYFFQGNINKIVYNLALQYVDYYKYRKLSEYIETPNFSVEREADLLHRDAVGAMFVTRDMVVSASDDRTIKLWDPASGELLRTIIAHNDHIQSVFVSGNQLVSGSNDGTVKIWRSSDGKRLKVLRKHKDSVFAVFAKGNKIVSGSGDKTIIIWDSEAGKPIHVLRGHAERVYSVFVNDGKVISGSDDNTIRIWDLNTGEPLRTLRHHTASIRSLYVSGGKIVSGSRDKTLKVWDLHCGELLLSIDHGQQIGMNEVSLVGRKIIAGTWANNVLKIYNLSSNFTRVESIDEIVSSNGDTESVFVYGQRLYVGSATGQISVWEFDIKRKLTRFTGLPQCLPVSAAIKGKSNQAN